MVPFQTFRKGVALSTQDNGPDAAVAESSDEFKEMLLAAPVAQRIRDEQNRVIYCRAEAITSHGFAPKLSITVGQVFYYAQSGTVAVEEQKTRKQSQMPAREVSQDFQAASRYLSNTATDGPVHRKTKFLRIGIEVAEINVLTGEQPAVCNLRHQPFSAAVRI
jgi:hypothetical protein